MLGKPANDCHCEVVEKTERNVPILQMRGGDEGFVYDSFILKALWGDFEAWSVWRALVLRGHGEV